MPLTRQTDVLKGLDHLAARSMRRAVGYESKTGRVRQVSSAALTTKPAIPSMPALAATEIFPLKQETRTMDGLLQKLLQEGAEGVASAEQLLGQISQILKDKGVEVGNSAESILTAVIASLEGKPEGESEPKAGETKEGEVAASVREKLGLQVGADSPTVLKALADLQAHVGFAPNEQVKALTDRIDELETDQAKRRGAELREKYKAKINPRDEAQMKWALQTSVEDPEHFEMMVKNAPDALPPQGKTTSPAEKAGKRAQVIATATAEFTENPQGAIASCADYVDGALREERLALLTDDETKTLVGA